MLFLTFVGLLLLSSVEARSVWCTIGPGDGTALSLQRIDLTTGKASLVKNWTKLGGGLGGHSLRHFPTYPNLSLVALNITTLENYLYQTTELGSVIYTVTADTVFLSQEITKSGDLYVITSFEGNKKGLGLVDLKTGKVTHKMTFFSKTQPIFISPGISAYDATNNKLWTVLGLNNYILVGVELSGAYPAKYFPIKYSILALEVLNATTLVAAVANSNSISVVTIQPEPFVAKVVATVDTSLSESSGASLVLDNVFYVEVENADGNKPALFAYDFTAQKSHYVPLYGNNVFSLAVA